MKQTQNFKVEDNNHASLYLVVMLKKEKNNNNTWAYPRLGIEEKIMLISLLNLKEIPHFST